jgi:hypothetical protein
MSDAIKCFLPGTCCWCLSQLGRWEGALESPDRSTHSISCCSPRFPCASARCRAAVCLSRCRAGNVLAGSGGDFVASHRPSSSIVPKVAGCPSTGSPNDRRAAWLGPPPPCSRVRPVYDPPRQRMSVCAPPESLCTRADPVIITGHCKLAEDLECTPGQRYVCLPCRRFPPRWYRLP